MENLYTKKIFVFFTCLFALNSYAADCHVGSESGYVILPQYFANSNTDAAFYITNHSPSNVEVKIDIYTHTGAAFSSTLVHHYMFSTNNDPFQNWASLGSREQGMLHIPYQAATNAGHARVSWRSADCLSKPVSVSLQRTITNGVSAFALSVETFGPF